MLPGDVKDPIGSALLTSVSQELLILASMDLEGRIIEVNDLFCNLTQYRREELIGKHSRILNSGYHPGFFFKDLWQTILSGKMWHGDIKNKTKSGEYYWTRTTIIPKLNSQGRITHFIDVKIDITSSVQKEVSDHFEEKMLREMARLTKVGGWSYYPESQELFWSPETYMLHEVPITEKITLEKALDYYTPESLPIVQSAVERAVREQVGFEFELPLRTSKGRVFWAHSLGCVEVRDSKVYRVYGTFQDISERKKSMDQLKSTQERLKLYLKYTPAAIAVFDREMRYLAWSDRWIQDYSLQTQDLEGRSHYDVFPEIPDRWKEVHQRVLRGEICCNERDQFVRSSGKVDFIRYQLHPWREVDGEIGGVFMFTEVITDRVMAEIERQNLDQKLYQTQKLESLGVMAGGIAHDFNNLLTGIIGNVEFVREDLSRSSKSNESLKLIEQASYQASQLCSQMLAYAGKGKLEKTFIQLNDLVEETWNLVQHSIDKRINVNCDLDLNLPKIFADSTQIRQIIMNLMINAGDAIGEKFGEIIIQTRSVTLNGINRNNEFVLPNEKEGMYVCLQVKDTGVGMSEETIKRIFEPFYTTKFTGRGLGLSAVLGMIKGHQGALSVESTVECGTVFQVYFPLLAEESTVSSINTAVTPWCGKGSVLLVEDEPLVREISVRRLKGLGFEVYEAEDGLAGWEQFQQFHEKISLVITDLTMPKLNGGELLNKIREIDLVTPCIVMSAYGHEEIQNYLSQYSQVYFLKKPGNRETFSEAVKRAYENKNSD